MRLIAERTTEHKEENNRTQGRAAGSSYGKESRYGEGPAFVLIVAKYANQSKVTTRDHFT